MQHRTTGRNQTRVAAVWTKPLVARFGATEVPHTLLWESLEKDGAGGDGEALLKGDS